MHRFVSSRPVLYRRARIPAAPARTIGTPVAAAPALLEALADAAADVLEALSLCPPVWVAADELAELNAFAAELAAEAALVAADAFAETAAEAEDDDLAD
jgi:hypothetical protein